MTENIFEAFTVSGCCLVWRIYHFCLDKDLRESYIFFSTHVLRCYDLRSTNTSGGLYVVHCRRESQHIMKIEDLDNSAASIKSFDLATNKLSNIFFI